jgi:hypothetical protein
LKELFDLAKRMEKGVEVVDRTYNLTTYKKCFIGTEAVDWLITSGAVASVEDAIALGNLIFKARLIRQVANEHAFENAYLFYRWTPTPSTLVVALSILPIFCLLLRVPTLGIYTLRISTLRESILCLFVGSGLLVTDSASEASDCIRSTLRKVNRPE